MKYFYIAFLLIISDACQKTEVNGNGNAEYFGRGQIESIVFEIDGKSFTANENKLYRANLSQLIWEFQEGNRLEEFQNGKKISQNYDYNHRAKEITISRYKLYPEVQLLGVKLNTMDAKSREINNLAYDYSAKSQEVDMILDTIFLLDGQISGT